MKKLIVLLFAALLFTCISISHTVNAATEYENNDSFATATNLVFTKNNSTSNVYNTSVNGTLKDWDDNDYYRFNLSSAGKVSIKINRKTGTRYRVDLYNVTQDRMEDYYTDYSNESGVIELFSQGLDKGTYYVLVHYYDGDDENIPYTLQVDYTESNVYEKENNDNQSEANWINLNTRYYGFADDSYEDYYGFKITAPGELNIDLSLSPKTRYRVQLMDKNGENLETWYTYYGDNYNPATVIHTGLTPGNYYLNITTYDGDRSNIPYNFKIGYTVNANFEQEGNDYSSSANQILLDKTFKGVISSSGDIDYYRVNLTKNSALSLNLTRPKDTKFRVRVFNQNDSVNQYFYTDYGSNAISKIANLNLRAGIYYVEISYYDGEDELVPYSLILAQRDTTPPAAPKVNAVSDKTTILSGTAEANSAILVKVGGKTVKTGTTSSSGKFSITIPKYKSGTYISVTAKDKEGNESKATTVKVKDTTPPSAPSVNSVTTKSTYITGRAEAKAKILVKSGSKVISSGYVDSKGNFKFKLSKQKKNAKLMVYAVDASNNSSAGKTIYVK
ncbi:Ig-like domain-containing protein [Peribacillus kribbensis]|uniref:Ig-like domain-containing protein n=1 Tax=Peribacillus kribbensis TaxID=356658 RepID=UPI000411B932|nr:Ig-like domain-containing protein [Peribacillus kribbensis]